jgi:hypothetical protein
MQKRIIEKERNISWFNDYGKRKNLIEQFYAELENMGINYEIGIQSYSHHEEFEFKFNEIDKKVTDKSLLAKIYKLTSKFELLINQICIECGEKMRHNGYDYWCRKCYFKLSQKRNIEDISDKGFSYFGINKKNESERILINWQSISKVIFNKIDDEPKRFPKEIEIIFKKIYYVANKDEYHSYTENSITITFLVQNFYELIRYIPDNLLNDSDKKIKNSLIVNLKDCNVCGYLAIYHENSCLVCGISGYNRVLDERMKKKYKTINEFYKKVQLEYYSEDREFEYPRRENEFEKSKNYIKFFTQEELQAVKEEIIKNKL